MVQIIWTDNAIQYLNDIGDYIAKDSVRYAEITVIDLFSSTDILETHPRAELRHLSLIMILLDNLFAEIIRLYTKSLTIIG